MKPYPRISIVTPTFNQGKFIRETIESILSQEYPNLEYIVMDGGSTDETLAILAEYPGITVVSQPDRGQWEAINQGFQRATGQIWGYLNSDDTLYPGALERVAREIDPARGRSIVMGRCLFVDQDGRSLEIEHPWDFKNHQRVLQVWKGHTIPQPAVFWTPEVWQRCGGMRGDLKYSWIDYDLFCRFSEKYAFHPVDQLLATYRLHVDSKTQAKSEAERMAESIQVSRLYWGAPWTPAALRLALSLAWYRLDLAQQASRLHVSAQESAAAGSKVRALLFNLAAACLAPRNAFFRALYPRLKRRAAGRVRKFLDGWIGTSTPLPQTRVYLGKTSTWEDGWAGPRWTARVPAAGGENALRVRGWADLDYIRGDLVFTLSVDQREMGSFRLTASQAFATELPLPQPVAPGPHTVEIRSSGWFVPDQVKSNRDYRPLSWRPALPDPVQWITTR